MKDLNEIKENKKNSIDISNVNQNNTDMNIIVDGLHPLERKVLKVCQKENDVPSLIQSSKLSEIEILRALQWLANKGIVALDVTEESLIDLDLNGKKYQKEGLPELRFLNTISKKPLMLNDVKLHAKLDNDELTVSLGVLKGKAAIIFDKGLVTITDNGKNILNKESLEEKFLKGTFPRSQSSLTDEERFSFDTFRKRKLVVKLDVKKTTKATLTKLGLAVKSENLDLEMIDEVTPEIIRNGNWKTARFRRYDVTSNLPKITGGRMHPLYQVMEDMRQVWIELGFEEISGPWVESAFWCMDSMWIPQDHPAREMQDTFYLPYEGELPKISKAVAQVHENGGNSKSVGYGYKWNPEMARALLLRTHTTAATFRRLGAGDNSVKPPLKCFCVGRIFRNEAIDATHLPEFHQIEGFVMGEGLTLRDLMGYIKSFYEKMGITKIKFRPTYNPYTEPSMEALGYSEELGWIELINSGMFRPESLAPYGIKVPVIAWGLGVERLAMLLYGQKNIRNILGSGDIAWLRTYQRRT